MTTAGRYAEGVINDNVIALCKLLTSKAAACIQVDGAAWVFNGCVFVAAAAYLLGGVAIGKRRGTSRATGGPRIMAATRLHPHYDAMASIAGLAKDGLIFTLARSGVKVDGYSPLPEAPLPPPPSIEPDEGPSVDSRTDKESSRKSKGGKKSKDRKSSRRRDNKKEAKEATADLEGAVPAAAEVAAPPAQWKPTPRSHLSSGARETGVKIQL